MRVCTSLIALASLALVPLSSLSNSFAADEAAAISTVRIPVVTVTTARRSAIVARVPVSGTLVAREEVLINPQVSGYEIETLNADVGDRIRQDQVLATLNKQVLAAQVAQAQADVARLAASVEQAKSQIESAFAAQTQAQAALERSRTLRKSGTSSQSVLDQAVAAADSADSAVASAKSGLAVVEAQQNQSRVGLELAKLNLERTEIIAPVGGIISERNAQIGAIASAGASPLFRLIRDGEIEVDAEVIETQLGSISVGDPAKLDIAGIGTLDGKVRIISPRVDPLTRLGKVRISLGSASGLRIGLFASGTVVTDTRNSLVLPVGAVLWDPKGPHVQVVRQGVVERRAVTAGLVSQGMREIHSGLEEGDQVLARAGAFFRDGDKVRVQQGDAAASDAVGPATEPAK